MIEQSMGLSTDAALRVSSSRDCGLRVRARVRGRRYGRLQAATISANSKDFGLKKIDICGDECSHHSQHFGRGMGRKLWVGAVAAATGFGANCMPAEALGLRLWPLPLLGGRPRKKAAEDGVKRVLIMMSDTGGGHRASAEALRDAFQSLYGDKFKIFIVDMWKNYCKWPVNRFGDSYSFMVKHPWMWRINFRSTEPTFLHRPALHMLGQYVKKTMSKAFDEIRPHLVVSVHPLLQHIPIAVLKSRVKAKLQDPVPFATVVTDLTKCHPTWYHRDATACFVPTEVCRQQAKQLGLKDSQIVMHGLPIRPQFTEKLPPKAKLRAKLGMLKDATTVMMAGGGEGMGNLESTLEALRETLPLNAQVVVICGRNKKLAARLASKEYPFKVIVNGFVNNMSEWMAASDCIITKAGPGTIAEALIRGVPLLLNGCVPCQEEGNVPFVLDNQVGAFEKDPVKIAGIIGDWFGPNRKELAAMATRAKALGRPHATYRIVRDLASLAEGNYSKVQFMSEHSPKEGDLLMA